MYGCSLRLTKDEIEASKAEGIRLFLELTDLLKPNGIEVNVTLWDADAYQTGKGKSLPVAKAIEAYKALDKPMPDAVALTKEGASVTLIFVRDGNDARGAKPFHIRFDADYGNQLRFKGKGPLTFTPDMVAVVVRRVENALFDHKRRVVAQGKKDEAKAALTAKGIPTGYASSYKGFVVYTCDTGFKADWESKSLTPVQVIEILHAIVPFIGSRITVFNTHGFTLTCTPEDVDRFIATALCVEAKTEAPDPEAV